MLTLYEFSVSPFCEKIRRALRVKGLAYRAEKVPLLATVGWYRRRVNPARKVPVLMHDGTKIADSSAIVRYLDATFDGPKLVPSDPSARALCLLLEDWADESLYFYQKLFKFKLGHESGEWVSRFSTFDSRAGRALLSVVLVGRQEKQLDAQGLGRKPIADVLEDVDVLVASVEALVASKPWLVGDALSIADIAVFAQLGALAASSEGARIIAQHPGAKAWLDRVDRATS
ncbi:MAG: glutathione S-transferase family protein [Polyangiaceae bacterium]